MSPVLVLTRTTGYRHDSIPAGVAALRELRAQHGFTVRVTEDPAAFTTELRAGPAGVVFLSTSGDVLDQPGRAALRSYLRAGGGFVGVHSAACTEYGWPWYGALVGAVFAGHPELQPAVVTVTDHDHPATAHLPADWSWTDEWYDFHAHPGGRVRVSATVDERGYRGGGMGVDHPLVWWQEYQGGRSFYTALGHSSEAYQDPAFRRHLLGALRWAARTR